MIDYFLKWNTQADAKADALILANKHGIESSPGVIEWMRDHVLPDVNVWRPSQDTLVDDNPPRAPRVVHTYLAGWYAIVATSQTNNVLLNATALAFALDRDGPPYIIRNNIGPIISDIGVSPVFAGSHYPFGGYT